MRGCSNLCVFGVSYRRPSPSPCFSTSAAACLWTTAWRPSVSCVTLWRPLASSLQQRHVACSHSVASGRRMMTDLCICMRVCVCACLLPFPHSQAQVVETYVARHTGSDAVPFRCVASYPHDLLWVACHPSGDVYLLEQGDGCRRVLRVYPCRPPVLEVGEGSRPGGPGATLTSGGIGRMLSRPPPIDLPTGATPAKHPSPLKCEPLPHRFSPCDSRGPFCLCTTSALCVTSALGVHLRVCVWKASGSALWLHAHS